MFRLKGNSKNLYSAYEIMRQSIKKNPGLVTIKCLDQNKVSTASKPEKLFEILSSIVQRSQQTH